MVLNSADAGQGAVVSLGCTGDRVDRAELRALVVALYGAEDEQVVERTIVRVGSRSVPLCEADLRAVEPRAKLGPLLQRLCERVERSAGRPLSRATNSAARLVLGWAVRALEHCTQLLAQLERTGFSEASLELDRAARQAAAGLDDVLMEVYDQPYNRTPLPVLAVLAEAGLHAVLAALLQGRTLEELTRRGALFFQVLQLIRTASQLPDVAALLAQPFERGGSRSSCLGCLAAAAEAGRVLLDLEGASPRPEGGTAREQQRKMARRLREAHEMLQTTAQRTSERVTLSAAAGSALPPEALELAQIAADVRRQRQAHTEQPSGSGSSYPEGYGGGARAAHGGRQSPAAASSTAPAPGGRYASEPMTPRDAYPWDRNPSPRGGGASPGADRWVGASPTPSGGGGGGAEEPEHVYGMQAAVAAVEALRIQRELARLEQARAALERAQGQAAAAGYGSVGAGAGGFVRDAWGHSSQTAQLAPHQEPGLTSTAAYPWRADVRPAQQQAQHPDDYGGYTRVRSVGGSGTAPGGGRGGYGAAGAPQDPTAARTSPSAAHSPQAASSAHVSHLGGYSVYGSGAGGGGVAPPASSSTWSAGGPGPGPGLGEADRLWASAGRPRASSRSRMPPEPRPGSDAGQGAGGRSAGAGAGAGASPPGTARPSTWAAPAPPPAQPLPTGGVAGSARPAPAAAVAVADDSGSSGSSSSRLLSGLRQAGAARTRPLADAPPRHQSPAPSPPSSARYPSDRPATAVPPSRSPATTPLPVTGGAQGGGAERAVSRGPGLGAQAQRGSPRDGRPTAEAAHGSGLGPSPEATPRSPSTAYSFSGDGLSPSARREAPWDPGPTAAPPLPGPASTASAEDGTGSAAAATGAAAAARARRRLPAASAPSSPSSSGSSCDVEALDADEVERLQLRRALELSRREAARAAAAAAGARERPSAGGGPEPGGGRSRDAVGPLGDVDGDVDEYGRVLVGPRMPLQALHQRYAEPDPLLCAKLVSLEDDFPSVRRVAGDGNCFYRACLFALLEHVLAEPDPPLGARLEAAFAAHLRTLDEPPAASATTAAAAPAAGSAGGATSPRTPRTSPRAAGNGGTASADGPLPPSQDAAAYNGGRLLLRLLRRAWFKAPDAPAPTDLASLEALLNAPGDSGDVIRFARSLTVRELLRAEDFYAPFIPGCGRDYTGLSLRQICAQHVLPLGVEVEQLQMIALCTALGAVVAVLDVAGSQVGAIKHGPPGPAAAQPPAAWVAHLPGHYDVIYPARRMDVAPGGMLVPA
ncbi:hypothetical protein HYH03_009067 [Edaphochlamys debaryana]|uniref:OTU domain-containing protein n=1 Tax=Edaphochlamys debaryana TaxID=47281 RepID=A0A835Y220_9CHLO|nr:hypothetical protein HYH03_009067 [Edaphochlamys debaryana]|eukprot:KAG2492651.1 hypothetical protein HYH03_009067 [Edaphochlamys debaryana]